MRLTSITIVGWLLLIVAPAHAGFLYTYTGNTYGSMLPANLFFPPNLVGDYSFDNRVT